ncbi:hypothetical protein EKO23_03560 [Nocardioides guangzhouensis]|uniref:3-hydroxyacyl-CoA dehydrogenase n=1 Tax=Nocardioides guangzhouensis TaxID=2497878 RepID=A0A4Q4ZJE8_9ACTN|nr:Rv3235 family protein [Nocardioides guangzhouensis]RYP88413.1 hypothetical protein EKO23_03560 [Nocardioides guangzhouensis]
MSPFHDNVTPLPGHRPGWSALTSIQGTLALDLEPDLGPPWTPDTLPLEGADVVPVAASTRRDLHRWAMTFLQAVVEVIGGDRPAAQLVRWTVPDVHQKLAYRAGVVARAGVHQAGQGRGRRPVVRPQVENVRTCFVDDAVVEVCARVRYGERNRAVCGRLELIAGRWQCVVLEFG